MGNNVPPLFFPAFSSMDKEQKAFYKIVESSLEESRYIELDGNISYAFCYLYKLVSNFENVGYEMLYEYLIYFSYLYRKEKKLSDYCILWANDCLLCQKKYSEYLVSTEPRSIIGTKNSHDSNIRLNVQLNYSNDVYAIDFLKILELRKNKFIEKNEVICKDKIIEYLNNYSYENGGWLNIFSKWECFSSMDGCGIFRGIPKKNIVKLGIQMYYIWLSTHKEENILGRMCSKFNENHHIIIDIARDAVNSLRKSVIIDNNFVLEKQLFEEIKNTFPEISVIHHGRPVWLKDNYIGIWMPMYKIAIEIERYDSDYIKQICEINKAKYIQVSVNCDAKNIINEINEHIILQNNISFEILKQNSNLFRNLDNRNLIDDGDCPWSDGANECDGCRRPLALKCPYENNRVGKVIWV